jgi:hypothetical protein
MTVPSWRRNTFTVGLFSNKEVKASRGTREVPEKNTSGTWVYSGEILKYCFNIFIANSSTQARGIILGSKHDGGRVMPTKRTE